MYNSKRMFWYGFLVVAGISILVMSCFDLLDNFWSGFGGGIAAVGIIRLIYGIKYRKNEAYAKAVDVSINDERNIYVVRKAKSAAFYITVIALAIIGFILKIIGFDVYSQAACFALCGMLIIYWVSYLIINKLS